MGRLPFDPGRVAGAEQPQAASPDRLTVTQLAALIDRAVRDRVPTGVRVVGEVGQFRERTHWYFDLKDAGAVVSCAMWASSARKAGFLPRTGMQVVVTGHVEFYAPQGRTTFMVDRIEPVGAGAMELELRRMVEELRGLGWLDEERKRRLPVLPRRVAVVTSRSGAALQDVLDTFRRRCRSLPIALVDVRVQGPSAAAEIATAVRGLSALHARLGIDVVLITRGGGSMEDLWPFNDREVARAIVECAVPVVAAIGHETDVTLAELVADLRAATPTQAAMRIAPDAAAIEQQLVSVGRTLSLRCARVVRSRLDEMDALVRHLRAGERVLLQRSAGRVDRLSARLEQHRPAAVFAERASRLAAATNGLRAAMARLLAGRSVAAPAERLGRAIRRAVHDRELALLSAARNLDLVGPSSVLQRGYSMTLRADGRVVRSVGDVVAGEAVQTRLADGSFASIVQGGRGAHGPVPMTSRAVGRRKRSGLPVDQPGLFGGDPPSAPPEQESTPRSPG